MLAIKGLEHPQHQTSFYHRNCSKLFADVNSKLENSLFDHRGCWGTMSLKPRLAAAANSNSGRARSRVCFDLPSFDLRPFGLFVVARSARGHLGSSQKEKMRFNALKPTNNPQWVPLSPSPESFFMAPRTVRQRRQAAGGWSLASTRLVCIKWTHVVFVSWSAADTNS